MCLVTQYVMSYKIKKTQIQRLLPKNFHSLKGVLRVNVEIMKDVPWLEGRDCIRIELNTPVSQDDRRGWFNLATWENCYISDSKYRDIPINTAAKVVVSAMKSEDGGLVSLWNEKGDSPFLSLSFYKTGDQVEWVLDEDNEGTFYYSKINEKVTCHFKPVEILEGNKEVCEFDFQWSKAQIPAVPRKYKHLPRICGIECEEKLSAYTIKFERAVPEDRYITIVSE